MNINWDDAYVTYPRLVGGGQQHSLQVFYSGIAAAKTPTGTRGEATGLMNGVYTNFFGINSLRITSVPTPTG